MKDVELYANLHHAVRIEGLSKWAGGSMADRGYETAPHQLKQMVGYLTSVAVFGGLGGKQRVAKPDAVDPITTLPLWRLATLTVSFF
jgi:hypothetical protein